jgi:hypothetical protein
MFPSGHACLDICRCGEQGQRAEYLAGLRGFPTSALKLKLSELGGAGHHCAIFQAYAANHPMSHNCFFNVLMNLINAWQSVHPGIWDDERLARITPHCDGFAYLSDWF